MTTHDAPEWVMHNSRMLGVLDSTSRLDFIAWIDTTYTSDDLRHPSMEVAEDVMSDMMACLKPDARTSARLLGAPDPKLADLGGIMIDPQMAARLIDLAVNPVALAAFTLYDMPQMLVTRGPLAGLAAHAWIDEGAAGRTLMASLLFDQACFDMTDNDVLIMKHALPETVIAQARGRRVDDLVSTPITDGLDLEIGEIETLPEGSTRLWLTERPAVSLARMVTDRGW